MRGREGNHVAGTPANIEWADGQRRERERAVRAHFYVCILPAKLDTAPTLILDVELGEHACDERVCAPSCTHVQQASVAV